jgi:predicted TIM-barrel fold metal-dependent hydrolase
MFSDKFVEFVSLASELGFAIDASGSKFTVRPSKAAKAEIRKAATEARRTAKKAETATRRESLKAARKSLDEVLKAAAKSGKLDAILAAVKATGADAETIAVITKAAKSA